MMFRDAKAGDTLYVYDRTSISLRMDKIVSVSAPKLDKANMANGMVVDVVIDNTTYTLKDTSNVGYTGNLIISTEKSSILSEVEAQKTNNEAQIARVDQLKAELPRLESVIDSLSPERKEKKAQEERLTRLEGSIGNLEDSIGRLNEMIELMMKKGGAK